MTTCIRVPREQRAYGAVPHNHGATLSLIGAVELRGMVATMG